mgnify:CR=1 FL=1
MPADIIVAGGNSITLTVNQNVLTTVNTESNIVQLKTSPALNPVISTVQDKVNLSVQQTPKNNISVTQQVVRDVTVSPPAKNKIEILAKGPKGDPGEPGIDGVDGGGLVSLFHDPSPQLSFGLDVMSHNIFSSVEDQGITFTPNGTGSINLDGVVQFRRFDTPPDPFPGGMYADDQNNLYFGVE